MRAWLGKLQEEDALRPDVRRAVRSTIGLMVPLALATAGWLPLDAAFVVIAAHSMTLVDVRGAYPVRFAFLLAMALVLAGTTLLGSWAGEGGVGVAVLATAVVAVNSGVWRHLTPEYGPALAVPAGLLFFVAVLSPEREGSEALAALVGAGWGLVVQVAMWPVMHEHPLRRAVGESWAAAGELFAAMGSGGPIGEREAELRGALDNGYAVLGERSQKTEVRSQKGIERLARLHLAGARLATGVGALDTAVEGSGKGGEGGAWRVAAESLANTARAVGTALVSRQPAHLAVAEVRIARAGSLLESLKSRVGAGDWAVAGALAEVERQLTEAGVALRATVERAGERAIFPLELLDLNTWRLRPLAGVLNLSTRPDPAIVRFTVRSMVVAMLAVWLAKTWPMPHGYWLPYTVVVVLQADYGATRMRAVQRLTGTLLGGVLGSALLMLRLPEGVVLAAVGGTGLLFAFFLRRNYGVAVVFITLFVVLLTEASRPVTVALTIERMGSTAAGGALAMAAAVLFWPAWERERFPALLAAAIRANGEYVRAIVARGEGGEGGDGGREAMMAAKRKVERENRAVFGSLERLFADPVRRRAGVERLAAVLANGNQRLTRALNVIAVSGGAEAGGDGGAELRAYAGGLAEALWELAGDVERRDGTATMREVRLPKDAGGGWGGWGAQLMRAGTEVAAMRAALAGWQSEGTSE